MTVRSLARALDPDDQGRVEAALLAALGPDLAPETVASARRWERRTSAAWRAGTYPLPTRVRAQITAATAHDATVGALLGLLRSATPRQLDDAEFLGRVLALCDAADVTRDRLDALGGPVRTSFGDPTGRTRLLGLGIN